MEDTFDLTAVLAGLAAPLDPADIKTRIDEKSRKELRYIDARVVITRLNSVCPGQWHYQVKELKQGNDGRWVCVGSLTVCGIVQEDAGMSETERFFDPPKAAVSDALKRCAVHFGVAIELYSDEDQRPVGGGDHGYSKPSPKASSKPATKNDEGEEPPPISGKATRLETLNRRAAGTPLERPWTPIRLCQQIALKVSKSGMTGPITDPQKQKLVIALNVLFESEDEPDKWRHSLLKILTGKDSATNLTKAEAHVIIDWAEKDSEKSKTEAYLAINVALEAAGQQRLPENGPDGWPDSDNEKAE